MTRAIIQLTATEGMYLTQVNLENESSRVFVTKVMGDDINIEDWREATVEERDAWENEYMNPITI